MQTSCHQVPNGDAMAHNSICPWDTVTEQPGAPGELGRKLSPTASSLSHFLLASTWRLHLCTCAQLPVCHLEQAISSGPSHHCPPILPVTSCPPGGWLQMSSEQGSQAAQGKALTTASDDVRFHLRENNLTQPLPQSCKSCSALQAARMQPTSKAYCLLLRAAATVSTAPVTCRCHFQGIGGKHNRAEALCWPGGVRGDTISMSPVLPVTSAASQRSQSCASTSKRHLRVTSGSSLHWAPESAGTGYVTFCSSKIKPISFCQQALTSWRVKRFWGPVDLRNTALLVNLQFLTPFYSLLYFHLLTLQRDIS